MNEFQQEYIEESKQVLRSLEQSLLHLEKDPDVEEVNNAYRFLHTIKGSAGMFGFHDVEKLAHELEVIFSDIRDGQRQLDEFVLELTLHAIDVFIDLLDGKDASKQAEQIIQSVQQLTGKTADGGSLSGHASAQDNEGFSVFLKPDKDVFKRGINLQAILDDFSELGASCELIIHNETIPFETQLVTKDLTSWFEIIIATPQGKSGIEEVLMFLKPHEYILIELTHEHVFTSELYKQHAQLNDKELKERIALFHQFLPHLIAQESTEEVEEITNQQAEVIADEEEGDENSAKIARKSKKESHISVSTTKLDQLINVVSELVIFRSEMQHLLGNNQSPEVVEALEKLDRLTLQLRDTSFQIRLVPLTILNVKLQRLIRSVSKELGKEIEFITEGLHTELDRSMINSIEAPLMHIIRNAIDHGIESPEEREKNNKPVKGLLKLYSYNSGDHVFIQVQDDGKGIDFDRIKAKGIEKGLLSKNQTYSEKELIQLMMTPGFSTAEKVTTVSGRGVGMDVVKKEIQALRGEIEVSTEKGLGTIFTLRLPLTLTVLDTLVVQVETNKYLIPINEIEYCYKEDHNKLFDKKSRQINYQGQLMPFVSLREHFSLPSTQATTETVIIVNKNDTRMAVVVDGIIGKLQTVYKPLNELLSTTDCFSGASILGDGSMALILNALKLRN